MSQSIRSTRPGSRYRWVWIAAVLLLVIVGGIGGAAEFGQYQEATVFRRHVEDMKRRGLPTTPSELSGVRPPDSENKVIAWQEAAKLLPSESEAQVAWDQHDVLLPLANEEVNWGRQIRADGKAAEALLIEASARPNVYWPINWQPTLPEYQTSFMQELSNYARTIAMVEHHLGESASSLRQIERMMDYAEAMESHPTIVGFLVSCGLWANSAYLVQTISVDLRVGAVSRFARLISWCCRRPTCAASSHGCFVMVQQKRRFDVRSAAIACSRSILSRRPSPE